MTGVDGREAGDLVIEPMARADLDAVLAIELASFESHELGAATALEVRTRREAQLAEELARPWASLRVARWRSAAGGETVVVGYLLAWKVVDELQLLNVAVAPSHRRRGVGRALVVELLARGRAEAIARVLLEVRASNAAALALYGSLGFVRFNLRAGYYADGEDAIEMERVLAG